MVNKPPATGGVFPIPRYFMYTVAAVASAVLIGWQFDIEMFKRIFPGLVAMNPLTAICFIFIGASFFMTLSHREEMLAPGKLLALAVVLFAVIKLTGLLLDFDKNIDTILFRSKLDRDVVGNISNRMAPNTALLFILIGLGVAFIKYQSASGRRMSEYLSITAFLLSLLPIFGYVYGVTLYYQMLTYIPMALHTAICFLLCSLAVLAAYPDQGIVGEITTHHAGGRMARKMLPAIFVVPALLGLSALTGRKAGLYDPEFAAATFTIGVIILLVMITWQSIRSLNRADKLRDATQKALENANEELNKQASKLEALNKELESFCYSVSHDLRAPLRSIAGYTQILSEDYEQKLDPQGQKALHAVLRCSGKMNQLIDALLEFSKLGKNQINKSKIDMHALAGAIVVDVKQNLHHDVSIQIDPLPAAQGDYTMISIVIQNLVSNAIKYSSKKEKPVVRIGSFVKDEEIVYYVKDNGTGFDMSYYHKLFGVFQRLHRESEFEGTGIGLATVDRIVKRHGGKVWAEAKTGEGSTFYFTLGTEDVNPM